MCKFLNIIELTYTVLNLVIMTMNFLEVHKFTEETRDEQRTLAAISVSFLWMKVIDWLRLFDGTAFYIQLIGKTLNSIGFFLIILLVGYMMFGSAMYMLNLGIDK